MVEYSSGNTVDIEFFFKQVAKELGVDEKLVQECYSNEVKWLKKAFKEDDKQYYKAGNLFKIHRKHGRKRMVRKAKNNIQ